MYVFFGNFQIDLNMSCDGAKEEIKNLLDYNKYEDYVDTFICPTDLKFLQVKILTLLQRTFKHFFSSIMQDIELSRLLLLIGYRPTVGMISREAFHQQLM